jgi:flagellar hook assembly protein FlgD
VNLQASEGNGIKSMNDASIHIYNLKGQKVKSIKLDPRKTSEQFTYWDGRDTDNNRCASGIYFINLAANGRSISSKKVTFIR